MDRAERGRATLSAGASAACNPDGATIEVDIAYSPRAGEVQRLTLRLPAGATVGDAIRRSGWSLPADLRIGVWGRLREAGDLLRDRDRVELYRELSVDPKEARRKRYRSRRAAGQVAE